MGVDTFLFESFSSLETRFDRYLFDAILRFCHLNLTVYIPCQAHIATLRPAKLRHD